MKKYMKLTLLAVLLAVSSAAVADESIALVEESAATTDNTPVVVNADEKVVAETTAEVAEQKAHWLNRAIESVKTTITANPKTTAVIVGTAAVVTAFIATCPAAKNLLYRVMGWKKATKNPRAIL